MNRVILALIKCCCIVVLIAVPPAKCADVSHLVISPTAADWAAGLADLPKRQQEEIRQRFPFAIEMAEGLDPAIYELRYAPDTRQQMGQWRVDLREVVAYYNQTYVRKDAPRYRLSRTSSFGASSAPSGEVVFNIKLYWLFERSTRLPVSTEAFGANTPRISVFRAGQSDLTTEANQAFVKAFSGRS
jgi:beta-glucanase (GH16 family)